MYHDLQYNDQQYQQHAKNGDLTGTRSKNAGQEVKNVAVTFNVTFLMLLTDYCRVFYGLKNTKKSNGITMNRSYIWK